MVLKKFPGIWRPATRHGLASETAGCGVSVVAGMRRRESGGGVQGELGVVMSFVELGLGLHSW